MRPINFKVSPHNTGQRAVERADYTKNTSKDWLMFIESDQRSFVGVLLTLKVLLLLRIF